MAAHLLLWKRQVTHTRSHTHSHMHKASWPTTSPPSQDLCREVMGGGDGGGPGYLGGLWESPIRSWPLSPPRDCSCACLLESEAHEISRVFDRPNHSLMQILQAPPKAARHVVGGGGNRWLEYDPMSLLECWQPLGWEQRARRGGQESSVIGHLVFLPLEK